MSYAGGTNKSDRSLSGWYRFTGEAGTQMPEIPPNRGRCGTDASGWLNDTHPEVGDGAVNKQVCFRGTYRACRWSRTIKIRNCGKFYVYEFLATPAIERPTRFRYCGVKVGEFYLPLIFSLQIVGFMHWLGRAPLGKIPKLPLDPICRHQ